MPACVASGIIKYSRDSGNTWTPSTILPNAPSGSWNAVTSSSSGQYVVAGISYSDYSACGAYNCRGELKSI